MRRRLVLETTALLTLLAILAGDLPAQTSPVLPPRAASMEVVDLESTSREPQSTRYYTIVGAVNRSAVFESKETRLSVGRLLQAADGLNQSAGGSIRILRNGRPRVQLPVSAAPNETVYPDEIVVVVPSAASLNASPARSSFRQTVPIACLGLAPRPVVLPLDRRISSLQVLLQQLLQPERLAARTRVEQPAGQAAGTELVSGTVVQFDPHAVDYRALQAALSIEPFPPTVNLDRSERPQAPPSDPLPENLRSPQQTALPGSASLPEDVTSTANTPVDSPPQPLFAAESNGSPADQTEPPAPLSAASSVMPPQPIVREERSPPTPAAGAATTRSPTGTLPPSWAFQEGPPEPSANQIQRVKRKYGDAPQPPAADFDGMTPAASGAADSAHRLESILWMGVLIPLGGCVWLLCRRRKQVESLIERIHRSLRRRRVDSGREELHLDRLLDVQLPIVEEPVELPNGAEIHGEATGHLRLQVQDAHEQLSGPHFVRPGRENRTGPIDERELRTRLREAIRSSRLPSRPSEPVVSEPTGAIPPVQTADGLQFDTVQPETSPHPTKIGALERALRFHARGQQ